MPALPKMPVSGLDSGRPQRSQLYFKPAEAHAACTLSAEMLPPLKCLCKYKRGKRLSQLRTFVNESLFRRHHLVSNIRNSVPRKYRSQRGQSSGAQWRCLQTVELLKRPGQIQKEAVCLSKRVPRGLGLRFGRSAVGLLAGPGNPGLGTASPTAMRKARSF